ncbi:MAG: hypothetical protein M1821_009371 [Bathelium mastoideum]|nr:MAG: hypothetical protein M1821_009371 [Bathelium mastoideum]
MGPFRRQSSSPQPPQRKIPAVIRSPQPDTDLDTNSSLRSRHASQSSSPGLLEPASFVNELNGVVGSLGTPRVPGPLQAQEAPRHLSPVRPVNNRSPVEGQFSFYQGLPETETEVSPSLREVSASRSPKRFGIGRLVDGIRASTQDVAETKETDDLLDLAPSTGSRSDRGSIELLEAVQFSDENGKTKQLKLGKIKKPVDLLKLLHGQVKHLPSFLQKGTDNIGDIAGMVKGDVLDLTMATRQGMGKGTEGLCAACSKMPFDQFRDLGAALPAASEADLASEFVRPLESVLKNRDWCRFCRIIFRAMCLPDNDPLRKPQIQNYIQEELRDKSFEEWADRANWITRKMAGQKIWPFGHSRDTKEAERAINSGRLLSELSSVGTVAATQVVKDEHQARVLATVNAAVYSTILEKAMEKQPLPCWIMIKINSRGHNAAGVLAIDVFSYGRAPRAPLSRISEFTLRVASEYSPHPNGMGLRYGRILDKHQIDLDVGRMCLEACEHGHGAKCSSPSWSRQLEKPNAVGFRVIDVQDERLVEVHPDTLPEYACLSYVWGEYRTIKLNSEDLKPFSAKGGLSQKHAAISKTIRAAMEVVRAIGKRFLWVDSLCIQQDDDNEKKRQIAQMDRIYGHAVVTIVAADGHSADSGLLGITYSRTVDQIAEEVKDGVNVLIPLNIKEQLNPWNTRAWTLQEKLLSRRLLVFSGGHMVWHCRQGVAREDMTEEDSGLQQTEVGWLTLQENLDAKSVNFQVKGLPDGSFRLVRSKLFQQYVDLVEQYTHRKMKYSTDVLNAVQGLLKILENSRDSRNSNLNMHGLMEEHLDAALLWQPAGVENVRLRRRKFPRGEQLPSWSWAGWEGVEEAHYEGGVRYEDPFQVLTDNEGRLVKVLQDDGEERIKPMLRWYMVGKRRPPPVPVKKGSNKSDLLIPKPPGLSQMRTPTFPNTLGGTSTSSPGSQLRAVNGGGLGLMLDISTPPHEWWNAATASALDIRDIPDDVLRTINGNHLVFRTTSAQFRLGSSRKRTEIVHRREGTSLRENHRLQIFETEIVDSSSNIVGWIALHDSKTPPGTERLRDFIAVSEAQYFGCEERVDVMGFPLYNVMLLAWMLERPFAERMALGKIYKHAWRNAKPHEELIVLG